MNSSFSSSAFDLSHIDTSKLKIQILAFDSYQCLPSDLDKRQFTLNASPLPSNTDSFTHVPILRIFGRLQTGHTCLLHVHNVFPYIYIPYLGPTPKNEEDLNKKLLKLRYEIELRMKESFQREGDPENDANGKLGARKRKKAKNSGKAHDQNKTSEETDGGGPVPGSPSSLRHFLSDISIVRGVPFYNYAVGFAPFLKISLLSPRYSVRLTRLLTEGIIFGHPIQPFEAHLPYTFQFLMDYNCYSCNWISLSHFFWRSPLIQLENREDYQLYFDTDFCGCNRTKVSKDLKKFLAAYVTPFSSNYNVLNSDEYPRMGRSLFELDTSVAWITNRSELEERNIHTNLRESLSIPSNPEKYINSTRALLADVRFQRKQRNLADDAKLKLFDNVHRLFEGEKWVEIDELREMFQYCIKLSEESFHKTYGDDKLLTGDAVVPKYSWIDKYPTSFTSVEILQYEPDTSMLKLVCLRDSSTSIDALLSGITTSHDKSSSKISTISQLSETILNSVILGDDVDAFDEGSEISEDGEAYQEDDDINTEADDFMGSIPHLELEKEELAEEDRSEEFQVELSGELKNDASTLSFKDIEQKKEAEVTENNDEADGTDLKIFEATQAGKEGKEGNLSHREDELEHFPPPILQRNVNSTDDFNLYSLLGDLGRKERLFSVGVRAPRYESKAAFIDSFENEYGMLKVEYPDPFFSERENYDDKPFYFAGRKFQLKCLDTQGLKGYGTVGTMDSNSPEPQEGCFQSVWYHSKSPPRFSEVKQWAMRGKASAMAQTKSQVFGSQIEPATQRMQGYKFSSAETPVERKHTNYSKLIMLAIEIHVNTRGSLEPDPMKDPVSAIFWHFDKKSNPYPLDIEDSGVFLVSSNDIIPAWDRMVGVPVRIFEDEEELIAGLVGLVELVDPDILGGYEIHSSSWGYIIERFRNVYDVDLPIRLSRVADKQSNKVGDRWGYTHASGIRITGRHMLNIWRRLRSELRLGSYTLENTVFHVLHQRIPHYDCETLTRWYNTDKDDLLSCALCYYVQRLRLEVQLIDQLEVIEKITEQSRLLGIDFYSVIYRGSQFRVESLLVRLAKAEDFILASPSKKQVFNQDPLQCVPLILEPESALYKSPLVVLDFQSLYPSVTIAYNYCYSTLLGRMRGFDPSKYQKLGVTNQKLPSGILKVLENSITISPNGLMFAKPDVRESLLAKMLTEILDARILVKDTMSKLHDDRELNKMYDHRQLALKLIANVTYGYTSATFSGRMPHSAIADSIVSSGRETLLHAISEIEGNPRWGAKVVYGDTDSLFIYLPGKTRQDAFKLGREMAAYITHINPAPMKLKFEKVYHPSILVSKKRYIGWKYAYEDQETPEFDAKGIETVRRDGIPAQQKIIEKAITILFRTMDISQVKTYVLSQFSKIMKNQVNLGDFLFGKEVRLGTYRSESHAPPGAKVSMEKMARDHRAEPQYKQRVFYVVKKGQRGQSLKEKCISPEDFLEDENAELDSEYYITKVLVPPLERIFNLMGVDIRRWYLEMPKHILYGASRNTALKNLNVRIGVCICCGDSIDRRSLHPSDIRLCQACIENRQSTSLVLEANIKAREKHLKDICTTCDGCSRRITGSNTIRMINSLECDSKDCPVYYDRQKAFKQVEKLRNELRVIPDW